MTDLIDRTTPLTEPGSSPEVRTDRHRLELSLPLRALLACLLLAAAVIHIAMVPAHAGESTVEGLTFVAAGWAQLLLAIAVVVQPTRRVLAWTIGLSLAFVGAWAFSRTLGLPYGAHIGQAEPVSSVDLTAVGLEVAAVLAAVVAWRRPRLGEQWGESTLVLASIVPVALLLGTTAVVMSPSATNHTHGAGADNHVHADAAADEKGLSTLTNGHVHAHAADVALDRATQAQLNTQLAQTAALVVRYPTVAAAEAAGFHRAGPFTPGLGAHYMPPKVAVTPDGLMDADALQWPMLIFDGMTPDAPLAGFMYLAYRNTEPEGFAGPNDHWHYHTNVCVAQGPNGAIDTPFGADAENIDPALCADYKGQIIDNTGYMIHVWTVPGYESSNGTFSDINPAITCPDGTYHHIELAELGHRDTTCLT